MAWTSTASLAMSYYAERDQSEVSFSGRFDGTARKGLYLGRNVASTAVPVGHVNSHRHCSLDAR